MSMRPIGIQERVIWRDVAFEAAGRNVHQNRELLHTALLADLQPADLVIGEPPTSVAVEAWALQDNGQAVRVRRGVEDIEDAATVAFLSRQAKGTAEWLPGVGKRRLARAAGIAVASETLQVSLFDIDGQPNDDMFRAMRQAASTNTSGEGGFIRTATIADSEPHALHREAVVSAATLLAIEGIRDPEAIDDYMNQDCPPSLLAGSNESEIAAISQRYVDGRLQSLYETGITLSMAEQIMRQGTRIRPSRDLVSVGQL